MDRLISIASALRLSSSERRSRGRLAGASRFIIGWSLGAIALRLGAELYFYYSSLGFSPPPPSAEAALSSLAFFNSLPLALGMLFLSRDRSLETRLRLLPLKPIQKGAVLRLAMGIDALPPLLCGLALPLANAIPLLGLAVRAFLRSALLLPLALVAAAALIRSGASLLGASLGFSRPRSLSQAKGLALSLAFFALALLSPRLSYSGGLARVLFATGASFSLEGLGLGGLFGPEAPPAALFALIAALSLATFSVSRASALVSRARANAKPIRAAPEPGWRIRLPTRRFMAGPLGQRLGHRLALLPALSPRGELSRHLSLITLAGLGALALQAPPAATLILALALILREALRAIAFLASDTPSLRRVLYLLSLSRCQGLSLSAALALALLKASPLLLCALLSALFSAIA